MARQISPCSSSSTTFSPSSFHQETFSSAKFSRKPSPSRWVFKIHSRINPKNQFELKSSNGYPLHAVSLQDGAAEKPLAKELVLPEQTDPNLSVTIVGASGDLAKKKIFPALFALFYEDCLPQNFTIFGYARTKMTDEELREMISRTLTCRIDKRENCGDKMEEFLKRCFYQSGQYNSEEHFAELDSKLNQKEVHSLC